MRTLFFITVIAFLLSGCSKSASDQATLAEPELTRQYREKSVTVIVSISETNITTAGSIQLIIDVHTLPDFEVEIPDLSTFIEPLTVADRYTEPTQTMKNGKWLHRRVWKLTPKLPGAINFQAIPIQAGTIGITIQPIELRVTSLLPDNLDTFEIRDIAEPVALLPEQKLKQQRNYIVYGVIAALTLSIFLYKLLRRPKVIIPLSAHETALLALDYLPTDNLARIHVLSEILVVFIGAYFHLPTSGKTIEEVIPLLPKKKLLGRRIQLEKFLVIGEQIRFSNKIPDGFGDDFEKYVRSFLSVMEEASCD